MADVTKRTAKRAAAHLEGELPEVAILCELAGQLGVGAVATVLARRTTEAVLRNRADGARETEGGLAASFPAESCVVALTRSSLVAMPSNGIRFDAPTLIVDRSSVWAHVAGRRMLGRRVAFTFVDGSQAEVDVAFGQPIQRFVDALGAPA